MEEPEIKTEIIKTENIEKHSQNQDDDIKQHSQNQDDDTKQHSQNPDDEIGQQSQNLKTNGNEIYSQNQKDDIGQYSQNQVTDDRTIIEHSENKKTDNIRYSQNSETDNIEEHFQNQENGNENQDDIHDSNQLTTESNEQEDSQDLSHSRNLSKISDSRKMKIRTELGIPLKQEIDIVEYENGWRKYGLRDKRVKKIRVESLVEDSIPLKKIFKKHIRDTYEELESYDCDICRKVFDTKMSLLNHKRMHHTITKFTCMLCAEIFDTNKQLIEHKVTHKDDEINFLCKQCPQAYTDHCDYLLHELSHQLRKNYKCAECQRNFNSKSYMAIHIQTHFDRTTECEVCHRSVQIFKLKNHMSTHSRTEIKCVECGKVLYDKKTLNEHMTIHTGLKLLQCYYCGRGFARVNERKIHMLLHTKEKPFECKICHSRFTQSSTLKKHELTHEMEKRYNCEKCDKKFFHQLSLVNHMSIHNNTQKYPCKLCNKPISTYAGLKSHMLYKHSGERNVSCGICNLAFKSQVSLNRHNKSKAHRRKEYAFKINKTEADSQP